MLILRKIKDFKSNMRIIPFLKLFLQTIQTKAAFQNKIKILRNKLPHPLKG
jgi:hypothetical protein